MGVSEPPPTWSTGTSSPLTPPEPVTPKRRFYVSINLDPTLVKKQFADVVDEVIQQLTVRTGVMVTISVEIQAESNTGFDDGLQRAMKENCAVLNFKRTEFESGD